MYYSTIFKAQIFSFHPVIANKNLIKCIFNKQIFTVSVTISNFQNYGNNREV